MLLHITTISQKENEENEVNMVDILEIVRLFISYFNDIRFGGVFFFSFPNDVERVKCLYNIYRSKFKMQL